MESILLQIDKDHAEDTFHRIKEHFDNRVLLQYKNLVLIQGNRCRDTLESFFEILSELSISQKLLVYSHQKKYLHIA